MDNSVTKFLTLPAMEEQQEIFKFYSVMKWKCVREKVIEFYKW